MNFLKKLKKSKIIYIYILLILHTLNCIVSFQDLKEIQNEKILINKRVSSLHEKAHQFLSCKDYKNAEAVLDSIILIKPDSPKTYFYLGFIYSQRINHYKKAEQYFKKAIELDRKYAAAYYELGMIYKEGPYLKKDAIRMFEAAIRYEKGFKDAYFQQAMVIMQYKDYVKGFKKLEELVLMDPDFQNCYKIYKKIGIAFHQFERMSSFLSKLVFSYSDNPLYKLDLIYILYRNENYDSALDILKKIKSAYPEYSPSLQQINEARILFAIGQDSLASEIYWQGIENLKTKKEAYHIFSDIIFLVTDREYEEFQSESLSKLKTFFRKFWKSRDPTLTTSFNERLPEHYQRLCYARKYNKRYPEKEFLSFFMKDFSNPLERIVPPAINRFGATKGSKQQQEIDDQGIIYVRHGKPNTFASYIDQRASMNVSWLYYPKNGRPKMIFHFYFPDARDPKRASSSDGWRLELFPRYPEERWALDARYLSQNKFSILAQENMQNIAIATFTETSNFKPEYEQFEIPFRYYCFKGDNSKENLYFCYEIPTEAFPDSNYVQSQLLDEEIVLFNSNWTEINRVFNFISSQNLQNNLRMMPIRKFQSILEPGQYFLGLRLTNEKFHKIGLLRARLNISSNHTSQLKLTKVMLGTLSDNNMLLFTQKLDKSIASEIIPNIKHRFSENKPILIYFEIYNLKLDKDLESSYSICLNIIQIERYTSKFENYFNKLKDIFIDEKMLAISIEDDYSGKKPDEYINRTILLSEYNPGIYKLKITLFDKVAKTKINKELLFEIIN